MSDIPFLLFERSGWLTQYACSSGFSIFATRKRKLRCVGKERSRKGQGSLDEADPFISIDEEPSEWKEFRS